jgi:hypothetical protein
MKLNNQTENAPTSPRSKDFDYLGHQVKIREIIVYHDVVPDGLCSIYIDDKFQRYERGNEADALAKQLVEGKVAFEAWLATREKKT